MLLLRYWLRWRHSVLIICAIAGVLCIYLGWRLYKDTVTSYTKSEAKTTSFSIKIVSAGSGVFFAAFGMWLLVNLVNRPYQMTADITPPLEQKSTNAHSYSPSDYHYNPLLHVTDIDTTKKGEVHCVTLSFFDGQSIDKKTTIEAVDLAIREITKGNPTEIVNGFTITRNQAVNILSKIKSLNGQEDEL